MLHLSTHCRYYLYQDSCDMRKGFDSLAGIVSSQMQGEATGGAVYIFLNRRRNQVKLLCFEGDGFSVYHKRLERGTYELPATGTDTPSAAITSQQLLFILEGVSLRKVEFRPRYKKAG
jgi:transposase